MSRPQRRPTVDRLLSTLRDTAQDVFRRTDSNAAAGPQRLVEPPTGGACDCFLFQSRDLAVDSDAYWPLTELRSHNWSGAQPTFADWGHVTVTAMFDPASSDVVTLGFGIDGHIGSSFRSQYITGVTGESTSIEVSGDLYLGNGNELVVEIHNSLGTPFVVDYAVVDVHSFCCDAPDPQYTPDG